MKKVTSKDVALKAGVSRATVSYVLNNSREGRISEVTVNKVLKAVEELNYVPNITAKALRSQKSFCIGIYSKRALDLDRYSEIIEVVNKNLTKYDYSLMICRGKRSRSGIPSYIEYYLNKKVDGLIIVSDEDLIKPNDLELIHKYKIPSVLVDFHRNYQNVNTIDIDYYLGAYEVVDYILKNGYKRVWYYSPNWGVPQEVERKQGIYDALKNYNEYEVNFIDIPIKKGEDLSEYFDDIKVKFEENTKKGDVIITSWSALSIMLTSISNNLGIKISQDIKLVCLGGRKDFNLFGKNIGYSELPNKHIGEKAVEIIIDLLKNGNRESVNLKVKPKFIINEAL